MGFSDSRKDLGAINKNAPRVPAAHMGSWGPWSLGLHSKAEKKSGVASLSVSCMCTQCRDPFKDPSVLQLSAMLFAEFKEPHVIDTWGDGLQQLSPPSR